jgi:hypothetical protein
MSYFERITSFSVVLRRVLQDGDTAVLELRQTVRPHDWAVVLSRRPGGWQAVDLAPGRSGALISGPSRGRPRQHEPRQRPAERPCGVL